MMDLFRALGKGLSTLTKRRKREDDTLPSSSAAPPPVSPAFKNRPTKINESLYEFREHKPPVTPNMVILFFHGFYSTDSPDTWLETWESEDKSCIWPSTWLAEKFPGARILYVSYSAILGKSSGGNSDMYILGENLASDFLQAGIGQTPNCPVILVGHCFGGLVIKEICLQISNNTKLTGLESQRIKLESFLTRVKGIFYYGTPHRGSQCIDTATHLDNPLLGYFKVLSKEASRLNSEFSHLCKVHKWKTNGLGEGLKTNRDVQGLFQGVIAPEACSRDGDQFNVVAADHISISKPQSEVDRRFYALTSLLQSILLNMEVEVLGHQCQGLPYHPVKLEKFAEKVQETLMEKAVLGICGMGGIGKTTLAKQVYNYISKDYEYTCFIDSVKGIQTALEDNVLSHFHKNGRRVARVQWEDLMGKRTLIVMDDIDSEDQLHMLPKVGHFRNGSNIIITSRDKEVLKAYENHGIYDVEFLQEDEGRKLFCLNAFGVEDVPAHGNQSNPLNKNVMEVVKTCGGLPLTLEVMGRYLRNKEDNPKIWEETIQKLRKAESINGSRNDRVWSSLRVSYDALVEEEQEMFIEAATFFFAWDLDRALEGWSTIISNSESRWENLVSRSMVKVVLAEYYRDDGEIPLKTVWVHEQLRDLAWSLAKNKIKATASNFYDRSKASDKLVATLNEMEIKEETKALRLFGPSIPVSLDSLVKLKKLRYLEMHDVNFDRGGSGQNFGGNLAILTCTSTWQSTTLWLPITLNEMNNLAVLYLDSVDIPKRSLEGLENLTNLRLLTLARLKWLHRLPENFGNLSALERLTLRSLDCVELPDSFGNLSSLVALEIADFPRLASLPLSFGDNLMSLKYVIIKNCPLLDRLPESFSNLMSLKHLTILNFPLLDRLPESFSNLMSLKHLTIRNCPLLDRLPESFSRLSGLQIFRLSSCEGMTELCDSFGNLLELRCIDLADLGINKLPANFGRLCTLEELRLNRLHELTRLPDDLDQLTALTTLVINAGSLGILPESIGLLSSLEILSIDCRKLERLPQSLGQLTRLKELELRVPCVKTLPDALGNLDLSRLGVDSVWLPSLRKLTLRDWAYVEKLLDQLGELSLLEELSIFHAGNLKNLPESIGRLQSLRKLIVQHCSNLEKLPDQLGDLSLLEELTITAGSLQNLPESIGWLQSLRKLTVQHCSNLEKLPDQLGDLSLLEELTIIAGSLQNLPESIGRLQSLRKLTVQHCSNLEKLPDQLGDLSLLEELTITGASLQNLPESIGRLQSLRKLTVQHCSNLEKLPDQLGDLSLLEELTITGASLQNLPESIGRLQSLRKLTVQHCSNLEKLPDQLGDLSLLEELTITAASLQNLPESIGRLQSLRKLTVQHCSNLEKLPDQLGDLSLLEELTITAGRLQNLPESIGRLQSLRKLTVQHCSNLEKLPDQLGDLSLLEELTITGGSLQNLPESIGRLQSLRKLTVQHCSNLEKLPDQLGDLSLLEELSIFHAGNLKNLPESIGRLQSLRRLTVQHCSNLEKLPDQLGDLSLLKELKIIAGSLQNLPESTGRLRSLQKLILSAKRMSLPKSMAQLSSLRKVFLQCDGCERLPDGLDYLPLSSLELELIGPKTRILPEGVGNFSTLRDLTLRFNLLKNLPEELGKLSSLRKLQIFSCRKLERLPDSLGQINALGEITLRSCESLKTLPDSLGRPSSPQVATSQGGRRNELMNLLDPLDEPSSNSTNLKGMRLGIWNCPYLDDSLMRSLGWAMTEERGMEKRYQRGN